MNFTFTLDQFNAFLLNRNINSHQDDNYNDNDKNIILKIVLGLKE